MRFNVNNSTHFVGRDVKTEPHARFRSEPDKITDLESPQSHAGGLPILFDEDHASRFEGVFDGG